MIDIDFPLGTIPERLKCMYCSALAQDAWQLSCCDSTICGQCKHIFPTLCTFRAVADARCRLRPA